MDKFILYKENIDILDNFIYSVGGFLLHIVMVVATAYCVYYIVELFFTQPINNKQRFLPIIQTLILAITLYGLNEAFETKKAKNYEQQFKEQTVQLKDIKDLIHVDGDKLIIDPLTNKSKNYYYDSDIYKNNERQLFRIDHDDIFEKYKLVDENNNEIKISKEDYEELRKGDK